MQERRDWQELRSCDAIVASLIADGDYQGSLGSNEMNLIPYEVTLVRAGDVPIKRHVKVKGAANPYDPQWEVYFEERLDVQMTHQLRGRRQLLHLWQQQNGLCPVCHQKITRLTGWHNHHIVWRTYGGSDTVDNRMLEWH